jgi:hypothetical protein
MGGGEAALRQEPLEDDQFIHGLLVDLQDAELPRPLMIASDRPDRMAILMPWPSRM